MYAHFLFEAFDTNKNGSVSFEVRPALPFHTMSRFLDCFFLAKKLVKLFPPFLSVCQDFVFGLSIILRGTINDRLNWAFNLYDLNKDGCITKEVISLARQGRHVFSLYFSPGRFE